ncbi:MAG: extracellular solute-binding protein [Anaerolineae bacterium]|nr:extracellular solute-binding protein [Anaerolineae bacterium]
MELVTRRQVLKGLLSVGVGAAGASALGACAATPGGAPAATVAAPATEAPAAEQPAAAAGEVPVIEWWSSWSGDAFPMIEKNFNESHDDVQVRWVNVPGGEIQSKLFAAIAAGNPPDTSFNIWYFEYSARGLCLPLDDYIAADPDAGYADGDIPEPLWKKFEWKGKQYGVPAADTSTRYGLGVNLTLIREAGLDENSLPATWDEVFEWHKALTTYDEAGNINVLGMIPTSGSDYSAHTIDPWLYPEMWGFHYFNAEKMQFEIDRPETVEFLNTINKFWADVTPEKVNALNTSLEGQAWGAFGGGRRALQITYPSGPGSMVRINPDHEYEWTWVPMPSQRKGTKICTVGGHAVVIFKGGKNPDATYRFAQFMTRPGACDPLLQVIGWVGPRRSYQDTLDLSQRFPERAAEDIWWYTRTALEEADEVWVEADPIGSVTDAKWKLMREAVIYGDLGPEEAAQRMQKEMDEELAAFLEETA